MNAPPDFGSPSMRTRKSKVRVRRKSVQLGSFKKEECYEVVEELIVKESASLLKYKLASSSSDIGPLAKTSKGGFKTLAAGSLVKGKEWSMRSNVSFTGVDVPEKSGRNSQTLSFNLTSRRALDEGWIVKTKSDPDLEENVLEWAANRLQAAIKQKEEADDDAKKKGCNKPVLIRYYGDSRKDTLLKLYRKGNESDNKAAAMAAGLLPGRKSAGSGLKIPQLSKMENTTKECFLVQVPDGSTTVYYPKTGSVAIMASATPGNPAQLYVNCYANDDERTCIATFTPYGMSCCYHKNGTPALILSQQGGLLKSEEGSVLKKWAWPKEGTKLVEHVVYQMNKEMYVRVAGKHNVTLHFTSNRESTKLPVGAISGLTGPSPDHTTLRSALKFSSKASSEYQQRVAREEPRALRGSRARKQGLRKTLTQTRKSMEIEELKQSLAPPQRFEYESQADRELQRLQDKSKLLVDEWMEHYRMAVGITSPSLKKIMDQPKVKPHRNIQSARERRPSECDEMDETKFQSFRCPSAPPRHMVPGPHSIMVKEEKFRIPAVPSKKNVEAHVRINESHISVENFPKSPSKQIPPQTSRQRPSTQGSVVRSQRSSIRTSSSAGSSPTKSMEKSWTPAPECCPLVARNKLLHDDPKNPDKVFKCKCSKHKIPFINDLEFDYFLRVVAPVAQLVVVCVTNSLYPEASPYDSMFEKVYIDKNKNRSKPCSQSRHDQYRILKYDLAVAKLGTQRPSPLLLGRHNVVPGMTLMYCGGRLLFADNIFNGYGNARNDFRKQVFRSKKEFLLGHFLPDDFRFTPGRGQPGSRAAWGGEMGGAGVDGKGSPGMFFNNDETKAKSSSFNPTIVQTIDETKSDGDVTSSSTVDVTMQASKSFDTARDFVQFTLSTKMYVTPPNNSKRSQTRIDRPSPTTAISRYSAINSTFPPAGATPHSTVNDDGSLSKLSASFARLQAVK